MSHFARSRRHIYIYTRAKEKKEIEFSHDKLLNEFIVASSDGCTL